MCPQTADLMPIIRLFRIVVSPLAFVFIQKMQAVLYISYFKQEARHIGSLSNMYIYPNHLPFRSTTQKKAVSGGARPGAMKVGGVKRRR